MNLSIQHLVASGVTPTLARVFIDHLNLRLPPWGIDSKLRVAAFLAQALHESQKFSALEENLFYTNPERLRKVFSTFTSIEDAQHYIRDPKKLANRVYANRLGNTEPDDGWRYRGRGIFQITGRENYSLASMQDFDLVKEPDLVAMPECAVITACSYWNRTGCNTPADQGLIDPITRKINGAAMEGRAARALLYQHLLSVL